MNNRVFIHYNADDFIPPDVDQWGNWQGVDSARVFAICADSWTRNGWRVHRLDTGNVSNVEFKNPRMVEAQRTSCPPRFWNKWGVLAKLMEAGELDPVLVVDMDCINTGFRHYDNYPVKSMLPKPGHALCLSPQWNHAACIVTRQFCEDAVLLFRDIDSGFLPFPTNTDIVSDEILIRDCMGDKITFMNICEMRATVPIIEWEPLICHYGRTSLPSVLVKYPVATLKC